MKNKIRLKQYFISTFIVSICLFVLFLALNIYEYHTYTNNFNNKIGAIINVIKDKYPEITDKEIITILNSNDFESNDFFTKYGINIDNQSILLKNEKSSAQVTKETGINNGMITTWIHKYNDSGMNGLISKKKLLI